MRFRVLKIDNVSSVFTNFKFIFNYLFLKGLHYRLTCGFEWGSLTSWEAIPTHLNSFSFSMKPWRRGNGYSNYNKNILPGFFHGVDLDVLWSCQHR